jgi:enoyl-CoA hydratase
MMYEFIKTEMIADNIAQVTIDRPPVNALNRKAWSEIGQVFQDFQKQGVLVVIFTGAGEKAFIGGADVKHLLELDADGGAELSKSTQEWFNQVEFYDGVVIAAVNGFAFGGGCEMVLACDIVVASEKARFGLTEVTLGLIPGTSGTQRLPRLVGKRKAKEIILTGKALTAVEAEKLGLVNLVTPPGEELKAARELAEKIAKNGPVAVRNAKKAIDQGLDLPFAKGQELETELFRRTFASADRVEGIKALLEKRPAKYQNK